LLHMVEFRDTLLPTWFGFSDVTVNDYGRSSAANGKIQRRGKGKGEAGEEGGGSCCGPAVLSTLFGFSDAAVDGYDRRSALDGGI
ncbi:hypothetical protein ACLOJK_041931, partial [Asimina triloba]